MNIFKGRCPQFKQELPTLIYLSIVQTWINFNFPAFVRIGENLGSPLNIVIGGIANLIFIYIYIYVFAFPEPYKALVNLEFLDDYPDPILCKNIYKVLMLAVIHISFVYMWYKDYYRMSNTWYGIWYIHCMIACILMYRAVNGNKTLLH